MMAKRKKIKENDELPKLIWDVPKGFKFECQRCGRCCTNQGGHKYLDRETLMEVMGMRVVVDKGYEGLPKNLPYVTFPEAKTLLKRGYDVVTPAMIVKGERLSMIQFTMKQSGNCCCCLQNRLCILHLIGLKPLSCRIYPVGIRYDRAKNELAIYIIDAHCPGIGKGKVVSKTSMMQMVERMLAFGKYQIPTTQAMAVLEQYKLKPKIELMELMRC